ncbi:hypothetical protein [Frankia sp. AgB32]|uniref:hypothetical protein n=1 Tax=Frankia sp. AgB32 TaxID=631119 RepID=UPI00200ED20B|nr:hypothetical protein [Frankia sp. AgB32]MCK9895380.1 hypothetical protein [Frankia sp. AgB32]
MVAAGAADGSILRWDLTALRAARANPAAFACAITGGGLSRSEWMRDVGATRYVDTCPGPGGSAPRPRS